MGKSKRLKIGIVGCGAIGSSMAKFIVKKLFSQAQLSALYDLDASKIKKLAKSVSKKRDLAAGSLGDLIAESQLVVEAASALSSREIARRALSMGRDVMIMSTGGVAGSLKELSLLAKKNNARVYIPSGAICGVDALKAAKLGRIKSVTLTTRKNPRSFKGVKYVEERRIKLAGIKKETVLFSGSAREAVRHFPQNINVAAVLSLAGIGQDRTLVRLIASPGTKRNIHEIKIESASGDISTRTQNLLHPDNPKTSFLAVLSAMAALRQILEPVRIGT
ncbi:MAG: aspartate dehydrogenase [Candidatus Omnitrophica bacterium]|nr:aspartate dehydrogenase [Candidatus Omnitrophota bacterium]MBL7210443.1 aspartate dehydrogenase [Candidatus Omnitrophota bacterium]